MSRDEEVPTLADAMRQHYKACRSGNYDEATRQFQRGLLIDEIEFDRKNIYTVMLLSSQARFLSRARRLKGRHDAH